MIVTLDPTVEPAGDRSPASRVIDGRLEITAGAPGAVAGYPIAADSFRDVVIDAVVSLDAGDDDVSCGLFFRQVAERSYLAFAVTPDGRCSLLAVEDGEARALSAGVLPPEAPFARGLGAPNRLTVVAIGPSVTGVVNGYVLTGVVVEPRFREGLAGVLLVHTGAAGAARASVRWAQVRAVLADQD